MALWQQTGPSFFNQIDRGYFPICRANCRAAGQVGELIREVMCPAGHGPKSSQVGTLMREGMAGDAGQEDGRLP